MVEPPQWTFLTNHAHVLACLVRNPDARLRDVAADIGLTERAVISIVGELVAQGYLLKARQGRRNHYEARVELPLRHPLHGSRPVEAVLKPLLQGTPARGTATELHA